jgi:hypothetical protein
VNQVIVPLQLPGSGKPYLGSGKRFSLSISQTGTGKSARGTWNQGRFDGQRARRMPNWENSRIGSAKGIAELRWIVGWKGKNGRDGQI